MRTLLTAAVLAGGSTIAAGAQSNCAERDHVVKQLADGYGEAFAGAGLQSSDRIFEVWVSEEAGTWTILTTRA